MVQHLYLQAKDGFVDEGWQAYHATVQCMHSKGANIMLCWLPWKLQDKLALSMLSDAITHRLCWPCHDHVSGAVGCCSVRGSRASISQLQPAIPVVWMSLCSR